MAVLLVSGSLRAGSTNTAALRALDGDLYDGMAALPAFNPDDDVEPFHPAVVDLRARIAAADALLFSTPEYAGSLPGAFKNLLDWSVGGGEIYEKPVAWVNVSSSPTGAAGAHTHLAIVLGYVGARIVDTACAHVPVPRSAVGPDGTITDPAIRAQLADVLVRLQTA